MKTARGGWGGWRMGWMAVVVGLLITGGLIVAQPDAHAQATATYVGIDSTTKGNWRTVGATPTFKYGSDGFCVIGNSTPNTTFPAAKPTGTMPSYVVASCSPETSIYPWDIGYTPTSPNNLLIGSDFTSSTLSYGQIWWGWTGAIVDWYIDLRFTDENVHQVSFYANEYVGADGRITQFEVRDNSGNVAGPGTWGSPSPGTLLADSGLDMTSLYTTPKYAIFNVKGHVQIKVRNMAEAVCVLNGIFFDPPPHFNVRTSGGSYGTPYAYFGVGATAAGGYWEQYRKTDSGAYPGVTGTALTFDTVRYEGLHQGCGGTGCHFVAPGVFFGNAPGSIPANQRISLIDSAGISPTTEAQAFDLRVGFVADPAAFVSTNRGDNGSEDLFSDWGAASGEYFHLEIVKDPGGNWRVNHSGTHFAADGVHEGVRPNLSSTGNHDTGVPIGEALALNWWLDGTTLHFEAGNTHLSHTDGRFITGVPAFFSGRAAWSDGTPTSYQILGIATPPAPLTLTSVSYDVNTDQLSLVWNSTPGATYTIESATQLVGNGPGTTWYDLINGIASGGATTTNKVDFPLPNTFYRIRKE